MKHAIIGWFFILTSYTGQIDQHEGAYSKTEIGGFATQAECVKSAANFPPPTGCTPIPGDKEGLCSVDNPVTVDVWAKVSWYTKPYNEASKCYR